MEHAYVLKLVLLRSAVDIPTLCNVACVSQDYRKICADIWVRKSQKRILRRKPFLGNLCCYCRLKKACIDNFSCCYKCLGQINMIPMADAKTRFLLTDKDLIDFPMYHKFLNAFTRKTCVDIDDVRSYAFNKYGGPHKLWALKQKR